jgi:signal peptidase I
MPLPTSAPSSPTPSRPQNVPSLQQEDPQQAEPQAPSASTPAPQFSSAEAPLPPTTVVAPHEPNGWRSLSRDVLIAFAISIFIILFLYQPVRVEGTSMLPRLEDQDRLFINKFAYSFESIHRGDVVVFLYPEDHTKSYIKRVIALPGDTLRIDHGTVYVNEHALREPYVPNRFRDERSEPERVIPPGDFWVMGDHRNISSDSRDFGPVPRPLIYGKAAFVYWPMDQTGVVH